MIKCSILRYTLKNSYKHRGFTTQYFRIPKITSNFGVKYTSKNACRYKSSESGPPSSKLPPLMDFPKITWPSLVKSVKNFILATFIIRPYFDREFNLPDFVIGSKKAVEVVSKKIAEGDTVSLTGLVTSDILPSVQRSTSLMSLSQREQIAVNVDDIYFSFPYQIGVMFNEENDQKRFVEITMVFHALRGLSLMRARGEEPPLNMGMLPEYQSRISVCNYRFIKEFTKGVESDWTINLLNHFKPVDEVQE
ncbi:hypothetical protein Zmor_024026 [Zophobas morio]|uniref:Uncharacterized protein n=1 Tax=Zophobas morio TaxID=2755281 RepID=A0AA38HXU5_9CUCU|nr:hypothetical protein Zmor_024026 [Zophobas morio]